MRFSAALTCEGGGPLEGQFVVVEDAATAGVARPSKGAFRLQGGRRPRLGASLTAFRSPPRTTRRKTSYCGRPFKVATDAEAKACVSALAALPSSRLCRRRHQCDCRCNAVGRRASKCPSRPDLRLMLAPWFRARSLQRRDVSFTRHDIVYSLADDVAAYLSSKLPPDRISKDGRRYEVPALHFE